VAVPAAAVLLLVVLLAPCRPASAEEPEAAPEAAPATGGSTAPPSWVVDPRGPLQPAMTPLEAPVLTPPSPTIPSVLNPIISFPGAPPGRVPGTLFEYHPTIGLSTEYSDNFFRTATGRRENVRTTLSTGSQFLLNLPLTKGFLDYSLRTSHDTATDELNYFHALVAQGRWQATPRLALTLTDTFTRGDEPEQANGLQLRNQRRTFLSNTFSATSDYRLANVDTQQYYRLSNFSEQGGDEQGADRSTVAHTAGATAATNVAEVNRVTLGYEYVNSQTTDSGSTTGHRVTASVARQVSALTSAGINTSYAFRTTSPESGAERDFRVLTAALFGSHALPAQWSATGSIGVSALSGQGDRWIVSGSLDLVYQLARGTLTLSADRGFSETFAQGENFGVVETQGVRAGFSYLLTPLITSTASIFYRQNDPTGLGGGTQQKETAWGATAGAAYHVLRWLTIGADYTFSNRDSSGTGGGGAQQGEVIENRGRISVNAAF
jgi:hypothetical protein